MDGSGKDAVRTSLSGSQKADVSIRILGGNKDTLKGNERQLSKETITTVKCGVKENQQKMAKKPHGLHMCEAVTAPRLEGARGGRGF